MSVQRFFFVCFSVVSLALFVSRPALFGAENHYEVFGVPGVHQITGPIVLEDQFGVVTINAGDLDFLAYPAVKNGEPIIDPSAHQTWWLISDPHPSTTVSIANQFGQQLLTIGSGKYLVAPARVGAPGASLPYNHYKCYSASGTPVNVALVLQGRHGIEYVTATTPELFCTPVTKTIAGISYPPTDPGMRMVCYRLSPVEKMIGLDTAYDQFGAHSISLSEPRWLCVPTIEYNGVMMEESTWGRIKGLYGD